MSVERYIKQVALDSKSTAKEYGLRLKGFEGYLGQQHHLDIDTFLGKVKALKEQETRDNYVIDIVSDYNVYLSAFNGKVTIASKLNTLNGFLQYNYITLNKEQYKRRVRPPKKYKKTDKKPLDKNTVRDIILAVKDERLQTYALVLAVTGCRAEELLTVRLKDINWENKTIYLRAEFTKTKQERDVFLNDESIDRLKKWIAYRERPHRVVMFGGKQSKIISRKYKPDDLVFTTGHHKAPKNGFKGLYNHIDEQFMKIMDANGFEEREENGVRHKVTFHSLRRFVYTSCEKKIGHDFAEWYCGHEAGNTYYRPTDEQREDDLATMRRFLTLLDYTSLEITTKENTAEIRDKDRRINALEEHIVNMEKGLEQFKKNLEERLAKELGLSS